MLRLKLAISGVILMAAVGGAAAQLQPAPAIVAPSPSLNQAEIQSLRAEQNRLNDQLQQDFNRQQDRRMNMRPIEQPQVPVVRPPCTTTTGLPQSC